MQYNCAQHTYNVQRRVFNTQLYGYQTSISIRRNIDLRYTTEQASISVGTLKPHYFSFLYYLLCLCLLYPSNIAFRYFNPS